MDNPKSTLQSDITLEQYIEILEKAKSAALYDLDSFDIYQLHNPENPIFSVLGTKLFSRDDEDCPWVQLYNHKLFLRFNPDTIKYIKEKSKKFFDIDEPFEESSNDKLYWEVTKYTKIHNAMCRMYTVYLSLHCEMLAVAWHGCWSGIRFQQNLQQHIRMSDEEMYLQSISQQIKWPINVELPYSPGDILYVDANPFGKPFYVVYCSETNPETEQAEWIGRERIEWKQENKHIRRAHTCLYTSVIQNELSFTDLAGVFTDYIPFPYAPLDRIQKVNACECPLLMKASELLKENPNLFYSWLAECSQNVNRRLDEIIFE